MDNFGYSQNEPIIYAINLTQFEWLKWFKHVLFDFTKNEIDLTFHMEK